jgi:hypothetical protein
VRIEDEATLDLFRAAPFCEWCKRPTPNGTHPHHLHTRGAGRIDLAINLVSLCAACHQETHAGNIMRCDLLAVVAAREGCLQGDIEARIFELRRAPQPFFLRRKARVTPRPRCACGRTRSAKLARCRRCYRLSRESA